MTRPRLKELFIALTYCAAIALLFFRGVVFLPHQFQIPFDLEAYHRPLSAFIADTLREHGHLPWWNPFSYMGEPFSGNLTAATFYPPTIIVALLGNALYGELPYRLIELQLVAHVALAGFGTYLFLRLLGVTRGAALAGAAIYELGGFFASHTQHLGAISGCAWLPFFLASLYRLQEKRNFRWVALSAIFLAFMILAGFPAAYLPAFFFGPVLYGLWLYAGWQQRGQQEAWQWFVRPVLLLGCAMLVGGLLAAASWLPAYFVSARSVSAARPLGQAVDGLSVEGLTSFIWPNLFGQLRGEFWLPSEDFTMLYYYQGAVALVLLCGGITWLLRSAKARPFLIGAGASGLWMLGSSSFVSLLFYGLYPESVRKGIYPYCLLAYFSLFIAVLCALALSAYEKGERPKVASSRPLLRSTFVLATLALIVYGGGVFAGAGSPLPSRASTAGDSLLLVSGWLGLCWLVLRDQSRKQIAQRYWVSAALCCVIVLDLVGTGSHSKANTWEGELPPAPPVVKFLHQRLDELPWYRVDTSDLGYPWQTGNPLWRLQSANGYNAFVLRDTGMYRSFFSSTPDGRQYSLEKVDSPLLDLAGIRYIITSKDKMGDDPLIYHGEANVFENPRAYRRFFLVGGVAVASGPREAAQEIETGAVSPAQVAVVSAADAPLLAGESGGGVRLDGAGESGGGVRLDGAGAGEPANREAEFAWMAPAPSEQLGSVNLISYEPNAIRLRVQAQRAAVLVATESFWEEWEATEDGRRVPLVRADGLFRAIPVSPGVHVISMFIVPRSVYAGLGVSLACLLLCAFWIWQGDRRQAGQLVWARLSTLWRAVAIFGAILAAVLLFLMIRNWISTGNPLHAKSHFAVTLPPVKIGFSPATIHAGESYTMIMPQPVGEWAGQWVDMRVACDDDKPAEVLHFKQLDSQGQVRIAVDPTFRACQVKVSGVRRSGDKDWHDATGSITVQR